MFTCLVVLVCLAGSVSVMGQNTKGDRPVSVSSSSRSKGSVKPGRGKAAKIAKTSPRNNTYRQQGPWVSNPSPVSGGGDRPSISPRRVPVRTSKRIETTPRGFNPWMTNPSASPSGGDRPDYGGRTASGRKLVERTPEDRSAFIYPSDRKAADRFLPKPRRGDKPSTVRLPSSGKGLEPSRDRGAPYAGRAGDNRVIRSRPSGTRPVKVLPASGRFVRNQSATRTGPPEKGKPLKPLRVPVTSEGRRVTKVELAIKSVSGTFIAPKKQNVYWGKISKNRERVVTDLAGRPLRRLNYRSPSIPIADRDTVPNQVKNIKRDTPWSSSKKPGYKTATRTGSAWQGDISGNRIRRRTADRRVGGKLGRWLSPSLDASSAQSRTGSPLSERSLRSRGSFGTGLKGKGFKAWLYGRPAATGMSVGSANRPIGVRGGSRPSFRMKAMGGGIGQRGAIAPFGKGGAAFSWQPQSRRAGGEGKRFLVGGATARAGGQGGIGYRYRPGTAVPLTGKGMKPKGLGGLNLKGGSPFSWNSQAGVSRGEGKRMLVGGMTRRRVVGGAGGSGWSRYGMAVPPFGKGGQGMVRNPSTLTAGQFRASRPVAPDWKRVYGDGRRGELSFPKATGGNLPRRRSIYLGMDAFRLSGARPGVPGGGARVPVGSVTRRESNYNDLRVIGSRVRNGNYFGSDLQVRMRKPQMMVASGIGEARSPALRRRPLNNLQRPTSRNPVSRPAMGTGLTMKRRPMVIDMDSRRLQTHPSRSALSAAVAQGRMTKVRSSPYRNEVMRGVTYSGFTEYRKHHYVNLHTPSWVKLIKGDFRNNIKVLHPSDRANHELGRYAGNVRVNPFRNRYLDSRLTGAGKMYFRIVPNHPFETTGYPMTVKQDKYVRAPLSSRDALKVREPDKAYLRTAMVQANVRMNKVEQSALQTDASFFRRQAAMEQGTKGGKRSLKNMFASMIGKSQLIPPGLKAKLLNPGYDPREKGLWAK